MPVSLVEWRMRIGRFIQRPPDINKHETIQRFRDRWEAKKEKLEGSIPDAQDQTNQSEKEDKIKMASSTQEQAPGTSTKEEIPKREAGPPCSQDQTTSQSAMNESIKTTASSASTQDHTQPKSTKKAKPKRSNGLPATEKQAPCQSSETKNTKMVTNSQPFQTPYTPRCTSHINLEPSSCYHCPVVMSSISQLLLMILSLMTVCFQWCKRQCLPLTPGQLDNQAESAQPLKAKPSLPLSYSSHRLYFFRRMIWNAIGVFICSYLAVILLMRSGDIETNPGPNMPESTVSEKEFIELAQKISPYYYRAVGKNLGIPISVLETILIEKTHDFTEALLDIFMKWYIMQQPPDTNKREVLADALEKSELGGLSEKLRSGHLIPNIAGGPSKPPASQTQPPSSEFVTKSLSQEENERTVSDMEFHKLAQKIPPSYYKAVGLNLGISYQDLNKILIEKSHNYHDAFLHILMQWNTMQQSPTTPNKREVLADALQESEVGFISQKLRSGHLIPNITGGPSKAPASQTQPPSSESEAKPLSHGENERCVQ